jgi:hypothetical protein
MNKIYDSLNKKIENNEIEMTETQREFTMEYLKVNKSKLLNENQSINVLQ